MPAPEAQDIRATRREMARVDELIEQHRAQILALPARGPAFLERAQPGARWTRFTKLALVHALASKVLNVEEALRRFNLSADELAQWIAATAGGDVEALRALRRGGSGSV